MEPILRTYAAPDCDIQCPFDVAVVIPTLLRPSLIDALRSVFQQSFNGRIQILIGIDQPEKSWGNIEKVILSECPAHMAVTVFWPGYSTSQHHGGMWKAWGGGSLRTALSFLANAPYVAYLDDDNWYAPHHLHWLLDTVSGSDWAFSRRWFTALDENAPICEDTWESVGPDNGVFANTFGGFCDTNTLIIDKRKCFRALSAWCETFEKFDARGQGRGADRSFFEFLRRHHPHYADTKKASVSYRIQGNDTNAAIRLHYIQKEHIKTGLSACPNWPPKPKLRHRKENQEPEPNCHGSLTFWGNADSVFNISVVIPSLPQTSLRDAVQSIYHQDFKGSVQILIGLDTRPDEENIKWLEKLGEGCPQHMQLLLLDPGYSTSTRHGGIHPAHDGGALRTILSFLAHAPYVAYLDDDNRWHPQHLSSLFETITQKEYAFSKRRFIHPDRETFVSVDKWESIGPTKGLYATKFNGCCDPNSLMIKVRNWIYALPLWSTPLREDQEGMSADRVFMRFLFRHSAGACTQKATVDYILHPEDPMHPLRTMYLGFRWTCAEMAAFKKRLLQAYKKEEAERP